MVTGAACGQGTAAATALAGKGDRVVALDVVGPERTPAPPPARIGVGGIDLFHDESREYAHRLRGAGVDASFHVVPGAPPGFDT